MTSQCRTPPLVTVRCTTRPRRTSSASRRANGSRALEWLVATTAVPPGPEGSTSSCSTLDPTSMMGGICAVNEPPLSSSCRSPMVAAISRAKRIARAPRSSPMACRARASVSHVNPDETPRSTSVASRTSLPRTPRRTRPPGPSAEGDDTVGGQALDLGAREAELAEHLGGVLAEERRRAADRRRRRRRPHREREHARAAVPGLLDLGDEPEVLRLGVLERLVELVDRPRGDP